MLLLMTTLQCLLCLLLALGLADAVTVTTSEMVHYFLPERSEDKPLLVFFVPNSHPEPSPAEFVREATKSVEAFGDVSAALVRSFNDGDKNEFYEGLGIGQIFDGPQAFIIRGGDGKEEFKALSSAPASKSTSIVHFLVPASSHAVQRLLLPPDWLQMDAETAGYVLDAVVIPALLGPLVTMTEANKKDVFREEFSSFALLFPPANSALADFPASTRSALLETASAFFDWGSSSPRFVIVPPEHYPRDSAFAQYYLGGDIGDLDSSLLLVTAQKRDAGVVRYEVPLSSAADMIESVTHAIHHTNETESHLLRPRFSPINQHYLEEGATSKIDDLTSKTLEAYLEHKTSEGRAVLVFYYSPLCPHSLGALPLLSEAATQYVESAQFDASKTASFARFDAKHNDVPFLSGGESRVPGFPSLVLYKSGQEEPLDYRVLGEAITVEGILGFIER
jgi:thiol-disulfide isomerase/thioredoxin